MEKGQGVSPRRREGERGGGGEGEGVEKGQGVSPRRREGERGGGGEGEGVEKGQGVSPRRREGERGSASAALGHQTLPSFFVFFIFTPSMAIFSTGSSSGGAFIFFT